MRILNKKQLNKIPMADQGNLYLGDVSAVAEARRDALHRQEAAKLKMRAKEREIRARREYQLNRMREIENQKKADMLKRSIKDDGNRVFLAAKNQGMGFVPKFGINNPLLGFVDEAREPDYTQSEVIPAQEFNNRLTAKNNKNYLAFKDYPLVIDAPKGDFGGFLVNEKDSADFSMTIVDDVKHDFGYVPQARRRK